jgi:hypothetical protein
MSLVRPTPYNAQTILLSPRSLDTAYRTPMLDPQTPSSLRAQLLSQRYK